MSGAELVVGGVATVAALWLLTRSRQLTWSMASVSLLTLAAWVAVQAAIVPSPYVALPLAWVLMLVWSWLLYQAGRSATGSKAMPIVAWTVLLAAATLALEANWELIADIRQHAGLPRQLSGSIGQPNHLGTLLLMGCASAGVIVAGVAPRYLKWIAVALVLPMALALPLTGSRTALLNGGAIVVLGAVTWWRAHRHELTPTRRKALWLAAGGMVLIGLFFLEPVLLSEVMETKVSGVEDRVGQSGLAANSSLRTDEWHKSWLMVRSHPLGVGAGQYGAESFVWQRQLPFAKTPKETVYSHSHNLITQVMAELGWPGLLILVGGGGGWLIRQARTTVTLQRAYAWSLLLVIAVHSMLEYPLWYTYFLAPFAFALGMADEGGLTVALGGRSRRAIWAGSGVLAFGILALAAYGARQIDRGYAAWEGGQNALATRAAKNATTSVLFAPEGEQLLNYLDDAEPAGLAEKLARNDRLIRWRPYGSIVYRQAILLAQAGRLGEAKQWLTYGLTVYPSKRHYYTDLFARTKPNARLKALDRDFQALLAARGLSRAVEERD